MASKRRRPEEGILVVLAIATWQMRLLVWVISPKAEVVEVALAKRDCLRVEAVTLDLRAPTRLACSEHFFVTFLRRSEFCEERNATCLHVELQLLQIACRFHACDVRDSLHAGTIR